MSLRRICRAILVCGLLFTIQLAPAWGDPPQEVVRTFAVAVNILEQAPDFLSEPSLAVVVAPARPNQTGVIQFADSNCDERFDSTVWELRDAMHITKGGAEVPGAVFWLLTPDTPEPPPVGAITFSGPGSPLILNQEAVYYETFGTRFRTRCSPGGAGVLVVVTAVFSR